MSAQVLQQAVEARLLGSGHDLPNFPNTHSTSALYRAYLWCVRNEDRLGISGQMAFSNVTRELERRGTQLRSRP